MSAWCLKCWKLTGEERHSIYKMLRFAVAAGPNGQIEVTGTLGKIVGVSETDNDIGVFLIYMGVRMALHRDTEVHPERNPVLRVVRRVIPMTADFRGEKFFTRQAGKLFATPLFAVIVMIGTTDVIFAVNSIPAIFAITSSTFVVWSANAFAVLGLRPCISCSRA